MKRKKTRQALLPVELLELVPEKLKSPLGLLQGPSRDVAEFLAARQEPSDLVYHMDLYRSEQLQQELTERGLAGQVVTAADLWDLPVALQTLIYPVPNKGERELKLDMIEQAYHALAPHGILLVLSPYDRDQFFPQALKKVFGKVHMPPLEDGMLFWCRREGDRPRRRHEVAFQVAQPDGPSLRFLSRPGTFSYGRFDNGARALVETMEINEGERILDVGCGCGTNGIHAGLRSGPGGEVVFVDSNLRAVDLTNFNAQANGLQRFHAVASSTVSGVGEAKFDVALVNPPYFAQHHISRLFIERSRALLQPKGRLYLVTKQPSEIGEMLAEHFVEVDVILQRGYSVFRAVRPRLSPARNHQER